jgi:hypothetical protein
MDWTIEKSRFDYRQGQDIFPFCITSRPALGPTQSPILSVRGEGAVSPQVKRPVCEAD